MNRPVSLLTLACLLVAGCAHAAPAATNLCPTGTKTVSVYQKETPEPAFRVSPPPSEGDESGDVQVWYLDATPAKADLWVDCYPNETGFDNPVHADIPTGVAKCTFVKEKSFTCK